VASGGRSSRPQFETYAEHRDEDDSAAILSSRERVPQARPFDLCANRAAASGSDDEMTATIECRDDDTGSRHGHREIPLGVDKLSPARKQDDPFLEA
jgi:hypothetical protein